MKKSLIISAVIIGVILLLLGLFFYMEYSTGKFQKGPSEASLLSKYSSTTQECLKNNLSQDSIENVLSGRRMPGEAEKQALENCKVDVNQIQIYQGKGSQPLPDNTQFVAPFNNMTPTQDACLQKNLSQTAYFDIAGGRRMADNIEAGKIKDCGIVLSDR